MHVIHGFCQARPNLQKTTKVKVHGLVAWGGERACLVTTHLKLT